MTQNISWILKADIHVGQLGALKELTTEFCSATETEPGVMSYEWSTGPGGKTLHIHERYVDSDAALAHLANIGPMIPRLMELVSITTIECYGDASPAFREAAKDYPNVYYHTYAGFRR